MGDELTRRTIAALALLSLGAGGVAFGLFRRAAVKPGFVEAKAPPSPTEGMRSVGNLLTDHPPCAAILDEVRVELAAPRKLTDAEQTKLYNKVRMGGAEAEWRESDCHLNLSRELALALKMPSSPERSRVVQVVASGLFVADRFTADAVAEYLEGNHHDYIEPLLVGAQLGAHTNLRVAKAMASFAKSHGDLGIRNIAWLALGMHEDLARKKNDQTEAQYIEALIVPELTRSKAGHRAVMLSAAANAVCVGCLPEIRRSSADPDPSIRQSAIGAWRWFPREEAVDRMCGAVANDKSPMVREYAAWALRWQGNSMDKRITCLEDAAILDDERAVRMGSTESLAQLGEASEEAREALMQVRDEAPEDSSRAAMEHLRVSDKPATADREQELARMLGQEGTIR